LILKLSRLFFTKNSIFLSFNLTKAMSNNQSNQQQELIKLTEDLIKFKSFSGKHLDILSFIEKFLVDLGFETRQVEFCGDNSYEVSNLWAIFNKEASRNIYFAGHTDVVATGDESKWTFPPFKATISDNKIFGRGAVDMKGAIACFMIAVKSFLKKHNKIDFGIGFLITNDEEADGINGTNKMLQQLSKEGYKINSCIVGEPTNPSQIGEMIKVGRRGSINFYLKIIGKQGHVAYPENAINPNKIIIDILHQLQIHIFDNGNKFFDPTHLEVTSIYSDNFGNNVIPKESRANFNIRFNDIHNSKDIIELIKFVSEKNALAMNAIVELDYKISGESFFSEPKELANIAKNAIYLANNQKTVFSTTGGTSDARFIKNYADEVIEFGLINKTAHQIDENIAISDLELLCQIYERILEDFSLNSFLKSSQ
jgi:succinyl-diaminopimelate desuccinylase